MILIKFKRFTLDFKRGIRNLYLWIPTIWRLNAWHYGYLLEVMYKQIKLMEKSMIDSAFIEDYEKYAEEMTITADAIKRLIYEEYEWDTYTELQKSIDDDLDIIVNAIKTQIFGWWW